MKMDFLCLCDNLFTADVETHEEFDKIVDAFTLTYTVTCPKCGKIMRCRDVYTRTTETEVEEIGG